MPVFAQITDLHLRPPGVLTLGRVDADRFASAAIDAVIARHPDLDAVLVTGDVTDLGEPAAYARATTLLSRFAVPVLAIPGNHDRTAPFLDAFCGFPGHAEQVVPGKACGAVTVAGVTLVALDTSLDDPAKHGGELGPAQLEWLAATLADAGPVLVAMHHPPFRSGIGFMDAIGLADADRFATVLARSDNVLRIVCGHVHRTIVAEVAGVPVIAIPGVAHQVNLALDPKLPPSMVMEPPTYAIHTVVGGRAVSHVGYVEAYDAIRFGD